jgi:hypothetical protein
MKTTHSKLCAIVLTAIAGGLLSSLSIGLASGQMMDPNAMMNPNMMSNASSFNPMFNQTQNITGSIKLAPTLFNAISPTINVSLSDAVKSVESQMGNNSRIVSANLGHENGYLTYTICAIDQDMNIHKVIVDPGDGKVLLTTVIPMEKFMLNHMMGSMMGPNMMGSMMNPGSMGHMMR